MATETQTQRTTQTRRSAAAKRGAATRKRAAASRSASAKRAAATREINQRTAVQQAQAVAERAVLVPVGAALTATDRVTETVADLAKTYGTRARAQKRIQRDVKRFERRGATARNRFERELKRTRTRVERELRQRRASAVRTVKRNPVAERVDDVVASGQKLAGEAQERVVKAV
jgi:hypothetical protein